MDDDREIEDAVDEMVDTIDSEAQRLGISPEELFNRVTVEMQARAE
jgi:hypothetical protein